MNMNILSALPGFILAFILIFCYEYRIKLIKNKPRNRVHFYVARDKNGSIYLYLGKPERRSYTFLNFYGSCSDFMANKYHFKDFGLNPDDFNNLKWEDEPVEVFLNMEK